MLSAADRAAAEEVSKANGFHLTTMFGTSTGTGSVVGHNTSAIDATVVAAAEADVAVLVLGDDIRTVRSECSLFCFAKQVDFS